jgi:putative addiction module component (TIGR02574 family)
MTEDTAKLVSMVEALPVDAKIELVDKILESLSPTQNEMDEMWKEKVESRIDEVKNGKVQPIPGERIFAKIRERFS